MNKTIYMLLFVFSVTTSFGQMEGDDFKIMFYNVENLFHPSDDSLTNDDDFTPSGNYHWTYKKYYRKVAMIGKVIIALGEGDPPWVVGLAEIENERVLKDLCYNSPLRKFDYGYVHYDSPDRRGVDVAVLYRREFVNVLKSEKIPIVFPFEPSSRNRDILHATLGFFSGDSLEIFVNHWTSRFGGYAATVPKRNYYAAVLRAKVDSILTDNEGAKILIMGDFNDYANNESLLEILGATELRYDTLSTELYNLSLSYPVKGMVGSHKHEDFWGFLDQMIVNGIWLQSKKGVRLQSGMKIYAPDFLLVEDEKYGGKKNYRTFLGPRYIGGFADHLPVYLNLKDG